MREPRAGFAHIPQDLRDMLVQTFVADVNFSKKNLQSNGKSAAFV